MKSDITPSDKRVLVSAPRTRAAPDFARVAKTVAINTERREIECFIVVLQIHIWWAVLDSM
jgi:hypothetical protein